MAITLKTRILLWGRSGNICAFPGCECQIIQDSTKSDEESLVADCCHIYADSDNGPRADNSLSQDERDSYENLILLCKVHHKLVDDQRNTYSTSVLQKMKNEHERMVMEALSGYKISQLVKEMTVTSVDTLFELIDINNWKAWTSYIILGAYPHIYKENYEGLKKAQQFILSRDPNTVTENIRKAFSLTNRIINDFFKYFDEYIEEHGDSYCVRKFYQTSEWVDDYDERVKKYITRIYIVSDLLLELTRSVNYIIQMIRIDLYPYYRFNEGLLTVETGITENLTYDTYRPTYKNGESYNPATFITIDRFTRDYCFGREEDA